MPYKITLLIPNYNRADALERLLESAFTSIKKAQAFDQCTVLVVDDFSTDDLSKIIKKYEKHPNFKFMLQSKKCGNAETAFLNSLSSVNSEYFWLLGNDDQLSESGVEQILNLIDDSKLGFILLNPKINKEKISQSFVPLQSTSPTVYYERGEDLFYDFGFVTSTTTFPCLLGKTAPVVNYHKTHDFNQFARVYSHSFTLFGALKDMPALFVTTPIVSFTLNERREEFHKLLKQAPAGIAFYHQSLGLARLIRETARATGVTIAKIGAAIEDEVDKDHMQVHATHLSHFVGFFFIEQLCREQQNIIKPRPDFGHLVRSELNEIMEVIEAFEDPELHSTCTNALSVFNWQNPPATWKYSFLRSTQAELRGLALKKAQERNVKAPSNAPRKIAIGIQIASTLRGVQASHTGKPI
ncbi:glycosyltransferase family 2 protein [Pseudomonas mosselii]|jgi:glycosyltransferase involved in cell wall biosynthesis|uniref:Glycosyltransferase n=1 Tax=Pseudomonas mosselii TaxID=78327 RepID=A0AA42RV13_9PSED|nr:glycosyltransferase family 2 protein [Pseudomonas mosselii]MDH1630679.1 glycosyltransferase [Pseudomonas mosselii]